MSGYKYFKRAVILFFKINPIGTYFGISNEILCILVSQGAATLLEFEVGGLKKMVE